MKHSFKFMFPDGFTVEDLIPDKTLTLESFLNNLDSISYYYNGKPEEFIEAGVQSLVEGIINFHPSIDLGEYEPVNSTQRREKVHGIGVKNGKKATVFIAFKGKQFLTKGNSNITEYLAQSQYNGECKNFHVFSDAEDIHERTKAQFLEEGFAFEDLAFYGVNEIKTLVDGNSKFWTAFKKSFDIKKKAEAAFTLYPKQREVKNALLKYNEGNYKVIWPTGTGKFEILMEHSIGHMRKMIKQGATRPVCVTISPRLLLIKQCIEKMIKRVSKLGVQNCKFINFTSSDYDNDRLLKENLEIKGVITTTSMKETQKEIKYHKGPVFIFTTYHSSIRIIESGLHIDLLNCDEAHNIIKGRSIPEEARKACVFTTKNLPFKVFYTATQALSGTPDAPDEEGFGMDNVELFGEYVSCISPKEMIDDGKIVRPFIKHVEIEAATLTKHGVDLEEATQQEIKHNAELNAHIACKSFLEVERLNRKHSLNWKRNGVKMLVRCSGSITYDGILNSQELARFREERPDVYIYAIADHAAYLQGELIEGYNTRDRFIQEISALPSEATAIIFHIDMIGEGLDVSGINAVLPFGRLNEITANQHLGRAMRLHPLDRKRLDNGEITPEDWCEMQEGKITRGKFYKPICYVVLPVYRNTRYASDMNRNCIQDMVSQIISNLGYIPYEQYYESTYDGSVENIPDVDLSNTDYYAENIELNFTEPITFEQMLLFDIKKEQMQAARRKEVAEKKEGILGIIKKKLVVSG